MVTRDTRNPRQQPPRGINFTQFQDRTNHVDVKYKDANSGKVYTVGVDYWPSKLNDDTLRRVVTARSVRDIARGYVPVQDDDDDSPDVIEALNQRLIEIVKSWDVYDYDEDGNITKQYEPAEIVHQLEVNFKSAVMEAITRDTSPGEAKKPR